MLPASKNLAFIGVLCLASSAHYCFEPCPVTETHGNENVFVERLWHSVKYEEVYLNAYESMAEAKSSTGNWIEYYNHARKYQTLGTTSELMYAGSASLRKAA